MKDTSKAGIEAMIERLDGATDDWNGERMLDGEEPRQILSCGNLREAALLLRALLAEREEGLTIKLLARDDGGLRIYSPDVRGLVLSHSNRHAVMLDLLPALDGLGVVIPLPTPETE